MEGSEMDESLINQSINQSVSQYIFIATYYMHMEQGVV